MEKLYLHIEKLLAKHHYVSIPDLGGFVVQTRSAVIFSDKITPPQLCLGFNPLLCHPDGLLAIELSKSEGINYRQASELIEKIVFQIKNELKQNKIVQIGNLGTLNCIGEEQLLFTPAESLAFLPENLGLSTLYTQNKIKRHPSSIKSFPIRSSKKTLRYAVAAIFLLVLSLFSPKPQYEQNISLQSNLASFSFIFDTNKKQLAETQIEEEYAVEENIVQKNHHVIVASLKTKKAAEEFCEKLKQSNYPNAHILPPSKYYKVAIESFQTEEEAFEHMRLLRRQAKSFGEAWVYKDKFN